MLAQANCNPCSGTFSGVHIDNTNNHCSWAAHAKLMSMRSLIEPVPLGFIG